MPKCHLTLGPHGNLVVSFVIPKRYNLEKHLFELSRTTDMESHFDPAVHTLEVIARGIEGHRPLAILGECDVSELPDDLYFRDAWEWRD